jgi:hypothetical protein
MDQYWHIFVGGDDGDLRVIFFKFDVDFSVLRMSRSLLV